MAAVELSRSALTTIRSRRSDVVELTIQGEAKRVAVRATRIWNSCRPRVDLTMGFDLRVAHVDPKEPRQAI